MKIAVCDDEKHIVEHIKSMMTKSYSNKNISKTEALNITTFYTGEALLSAVKGSKHVPPSILISFSSIYR